MSQGSSLEKVAKDFPKLQFAIVDTVVARPNVQSIVFKEHEGSFLVGMMAAIDVAVDGTPGARGHEAQKRLYDTGLNLKSTGDALIIAPPLVCEDKHLDEIVTKVRAVLQGL